MNKFVIYTNPYKDVEGAPVKGENNSHRQNDIDLTFNDVKLSRSYYNGSFFANRSITLESAAVDGWEITEDYGTGEPVQMTVEGPKLSYKIPTGCRGVSVVARTETGNGVMAQYNLDDEAAQEFYDMSGRRLSKPQRGVNIIKTRNGVKKVMTK